ncbi:fimbrial protein [Stenotrophomonas maltophilia]|uniref:fimbrial protein n=1 Tax=Stenotrophomonas maltophilia TaxID=40324 RepID=UPI0034DAE0CB
MSIIRLCSAPGLVFLLLLPATAVACTSVIASQTIDGTTEVANADPTGTLLASVPWSGGAFAFSGCSGRQPIEIDLALVGLTYVQDVQMRGLTFPAYETSPTSPLLVFEHRSGTTNGSSNSIALRLGRNVDPNGSRVGLNPYRSHVLAHVVARGGVMSAIPYAFLGTATTWPQNFPAVSRTVPISVGVDVLPPTCALSDASIALEDISADLLPSAGDSGGEKEITAVMRCPGPGVSVDLTLADAHAPANTGSVLQPTSDSDARGVRIEVLRGGFPVQFGQKWSHGVSMGGSEDIRLSARYIRSSDEVAPGLIKGEALLTADYR